MSHDKEPIMDGDGFGEYSSLLKESAKTPNKFQSYTEFDNKENSYTVNIADDTFNMASSDKTFDAFDDSCNNMKQRWSCTPGSSPAINRSAYDSRDRSMNNSLTDNNNSTCTALDFENGNVILSSHNYSSDVLGMDTSLDNSRIKIVEHTSAINISLDSCRNNTQLQDCSIESSKVPNIIITSAEEFKHDTTSPLSIKIRSDDESNSKDHQGASSPILRGIKNVINMFSPSQSHRVGRLQTVSPSGTSADCAKNFNKSTEKPSPVANRSSEKIAVTPDKKIQQKNSVTNRTFEGETKKQDSSDFVTVFINDIQWTDDSTIIFNTKKSKGNRTFISPAIAAIDKIISLGGSPSRGSPPRLVDIRDTSSANYFQQQMEAAKRLLSEREEEYKKKVSDLEKSNAEHAGNVKALEAKLLEQSKQNARMIKLNQEYEQTILSLLSKRDDDKKKHKEENSKLVRERDEQTAHLSSMEHSFNDLHAKYEKSITMIFSFKSNEEILKKRIVDCEASCKKLEEVYEQIKKHATTTLNESNQTLATMKKAHQVETVKLNAMIKKKELDISSLQETRTQKIKENEPLESICDELLITVG